MRQNRIIKFIGATLLFCSALSNAHIAAASSHLDKVSLRPHAPEVDMIITGANGDTRGLKVVPARGKDKSDCPLCFHRNLMKTQKGHKLLKPSQPFPGD